MSHIWFGTKETNLDLKKFVLLIFHTSIITRNHQHQQFNSSNQVQQLTQLYIPVGYETELMYRRFILPN